MQSSPSWPAAKSGPGWTAGPAGARRAGPFKFVGCCHAPADSVRATRSPPSRGGGNNGQALTDVVERSLMGSSAPSFARRGPRQAGPGPGGCHDGKRRRRDFSSAWTPTLSSSAPYFLFARAFTFPCVLYDAAQSASESLAGTTPRSAPVSPTVTAVPMCLLSRHA
jgi:hypothetical protein